MRFVECCLRYREDFRRGKSIFAELADGACGIAFGQADAVAIADEGVVKVEWLAEAEDGLELALDVSGSEQIFTSRDMRDILKFIIHHHGEVIGCANVFSSQDDIAVDHSIHRCDAEAEVVEGEDAMDLRGLCGVETP